MTLAAAIALIAAAIAPFISALAINPAISATRKRLISGAVALVLGIIVAVATGAITGIPQTLIDKLSWALISIGVVVSISQGFYKAWKGAVDKLAAKSSGVRYIEEQ